MSILILLLMVTTLHTSTSAPKGTLQPFELAMLDKLHQPWAKPDKKPAYPRKGEFLCKAGVCKPKKGCDDCQYEVPLDDFSRFDTIE